MPRIEQNPQLNKEQSLIRVYAERVPHRLIDGVVPNPMARDFLPKSHHYLASEDSLRHHTYLTLPTATEDFDRVEEFNSTSHFCRALRYTKEPLLVPYADTCVGLFAYAKGTNLSGSRYPEVDGSKPLFTEKTIPSGFYGHSDAFNKETFYSNGLLENKNRVQLVTGTVILNPQKTKKHLRYIWDKYYNNGFYSKNHIDHATESIGNRISRQIEIVGENQDLLAQIHRLGSSESRITYTKASNLPFIIPEVSQVWLAEIHTYGANDDWKERFLRYTDPNILKEGLGKLANGYKIDDKEYQHLRAYWFGIARTEIDRLEKLPQPFRKARTRYLAEKDFDLGLYATDWEEVDNTLQTINIQIPAYYYRLRKMNQYLNASGYLKSVFTSRDFIEEEEMYSQ